MGLFWYLRRIKLDSLFYLESYDYSAVKDEKIKQEVKKAQDLIKQIKESRKITPDFIDNLVDANRELIGFLIEEELNKKNISKGHAKTIESKSLGGKMTIISDKDEDYFKRLDKKSELLGNKEKNLFGFAEFNGENYHAYSDIYGCLKYLFKRNYPLFFNEYFFPNFPFGKKIKIQRFDYEIARAMTTKELKEIKKVTAHYSPVVAMLPYSIWKAMQKRKGKTANLFKYLKEKRKKKCIYFVTRDKISSPRSDIRNYFEINDIRKISLGKDIRQMLPEMEELLKEWKGLTLKKIEDIIKSNNRFKNDGAELTFSAEDAYELLKEPRGYEFTKKVYDYLKNVSDDELIIWDHHY